jgi:two-component system, NtrC family, nitrogen regulation response regulator NtrX
VDTKHRILLIDDDKNFTETFSIILEDEGYTTDVAGSSEEALAKLEDEFYALIIIDIGLPGMDGLELITKINKTDPDMRKIILTGSPSMDHVKTALKRGAHDYLTKPVQLAELKETIKTQLEVLESELKEKYKTLA